MDRRFALIIAFLGLVLPGTSNVTQAEGTAATAVHLTTGMSRLSAATSGRRLWQASVKAIPAVHSVHAEGRLVLGSRTGFFAQLYAGDCDWGGQQSLLSVRIQQVQKFSSTGTLISTWG
jgi:hypothetical protein